MTIRWNLAGIWLHQVEIGSLVCWSSDRLPAGFYIVRYKKNNREHAGDFSHQNMTFFQNLADTLHIECVGNQHKRDGQERYSTTWNKRNNVMSLFSGIFWP